MVKESNTFFSVKEVSDNWKSAVNIIHYISVWGGGT